MRAQANIYHVTCFTCSICNCILQTGDHFGIFDSKIYCRSDFEQLQYSTLGSIDDPSANQCPTSTLTNCSPVSINMISSTGVTSCPPSQCVNGLTVTSSISPVNIPTNANNFEELNFGDYPPPLSHPDFSHTHESQLTESKTQRQRKRRQQDTIPSHIGRATEQQWPLGKKLYG